MSFFEELQIDADRFRAVLRLAKKEDLGDCGDITTAAAGIPAGRLAPASLVTKAPGVVAGLQLVPSILDEYDSRLSWEPRAVDDGDTVQAGSSLGTIRGPVDALLTCERVVLNFLQRLSGIATLTRRYVKRIAGTSAAIYDTRKTTPGMRDLERYAVRCGGGCNHRRGLYDAILIKENYLAAAEPSRLASFAFDLLNRASEAGVRPTFVEFEVTSLSQLEQLLSVVGIDIIMLDNFSLSDIGEAVRIRNDLNLSGKVALEVSGGVTLKSVRAIADTGVERISVGALTHSAPALDISIEMKSQKPKAKSPNKK